MEYEYTTLEDLVRIQYANIFWTHKIQEKQTEIYEFRHKIFSWINIISASLTSAGIVSIVFIDEFWIKLFSAILSFVTTTISALLATFDYKSLAKSNKATATKLVCYRNELLSLLVKIKIKERPVRELFDEFEILQNDIHELYQNAPNTTNSAVKKQGKLSLDPYSRSLYLFCGRNSSKIKGMLWEEDNYMSVFNNNLMFIVLRRH